MATGALLLMAALPFATALRTVEPAARLVIAPSTVPAGPALAAVATPALIIFALIPHFLMKVAFGPDLTLAADALPVLGVAMTLLAVAYLTVQYMVALGELKFVWVLGVVAIVEPFLLSAGDFTLLSYATVVLGLQLVAAGAVLALGLRTRRLRAFLPHRDRAGVPVGRGRATRSAIRRSF